MAEAKKKVLVVDDDMDTREIISMKLQAHGYDVVTASDGQEGTLKARAEKPNLIVLDVMLPRSSGFKVARMLKFDPELGKIPIILLTARVQQSDKETGAQVGADDYMVKPFDPDELLQKINKILEGQKEAG